MSYTDLELGKEVKLVNGSSTESKFLFSQINILLGGIIKLNKKVESEKSL